MNASLHTHWRRLGAVILAVALVLTVSAAATPRPAAGASEHFGANPTCDTYKVRRGDTLKKVAARFGLTPADLAAANKLRPGARLPVGRRLCIPKAWPAPATAIEVFSPVAGGMYHSPIEIIGNSLTFEGVVNLRLSLTDGTVLAERTAQGGGTEHRFFHSYVRFEILEQDPQPHDATLEVFEISAKDGSEINKVTIPITVAPGQRSIDVLQPAVGAKVCNPIPVAGYSFTFEANVNLAAQSREGATLLEDNAMGGGIDYQDWSAELGPVPPTQRAVLVSVHDHSAKDGQAIDETRIPVTLLAAGSNACP
ncbi:MAG: LysM peptidoglycan-binding domain-containing protein [Caldilineales bacterium]|nr:LysM peptidoglycan-binding domain-containing protein [Caldilineales bacterium]